MRNQAETVQDSATGVIPCAPWRVTEAVPLPGFRVSVRFVDGTSGEVDLSSLIEGSDAGIFAVLRDSKLFEEVYVENGAVTWPGEIDLAPDAMYDEIRKSGTWVP